MKKRIPFETHLTRMFLLSSVPLLFLLLWVMVYADISIWLILLTLFLGSLLVALTNIAIRQKATYQFRGLSNLLEAMIHGEYSLRACAGESDGALDELIATINGLAEKLTEQRWEAEENQLLVSIIIDHIDVAIVALDPENQISFLNPAAKNLLQLKGAQPNEKLLSQLGAIEDIPSGSNRVVDLRLAKHMGRFNVHIGEFRKAGLQHKLLFISDVTVLLRSEESKAWQSLVKVISHEINNSLSPIASISQTLNRMIQRQGSSLDNRQDLVEGLTIISERAKGLSAFVDSYKQLSRLPEPNRQKVSILGLLEKTKALFDGQTITIQSVPDIHISIDPVQFEQVFINLFKNAFEAMAKVEPDGCIVVKGVAAGPFLNLMVYDEGSGIINPDNLFVPFFSTKESGSGIGLVLCRQIIEAHGGRLILANRVNTRGCVATIEFPLAR